MTFQVTLLLGVINVLVAQADQVSPIERYNAIVSRAKIAIQYRDRELYNLDLQAAMAASQEINRNNTKLQQAGKSPLQVQQFPTFELQQQAIQIRQSQQIE